MSSWKGKVVLQSRPKKSTRQRSLAQRAWVANFKDVMCLLKRMDPIGTNDARENWSGNNWTYRDALITALSGKLHGIDGEVRVTTPTVFVHRTTSESLTSGVFKTLTANTLDWDNNHFWSSTVNPSRITFRNAGLYIVGAQVQFSQNSSANLHAGIRLNASSEIVINSHSGEASFPPVLGPMTIWYFHANDYIEPYVVVNQASMNSTLLGFWALAITPESVLP